MGLQNPHPDILLFFRESNPCEEEMLLLVCLETSGILKIGKMPSVLMLF
jgi:hypothetical protein